MGDYDYECFTNNIGSFRSIECILVKMRDKGVLSADDFDVAITQMESISGMISDCYELLDKKEEG